MPIHSLKDLKGDDGGDGVPPGAMDGPVDGEKVITSLWEVNWIQQNVLIIIVA